MKSRVFISETIGHVSTITEAPSTPLAVMVLAHGAGAGMEHRFMENLVMALKEQSIASVRFNFPFVEKGSRRPDVPAVAEKTVDVLLSYVQNEFVGMPVFLSGKSFGGRMSSQYFSKKHPSGVAGIIFYGFPLHPAGEPGTQRADHLRSITIPMLFLQGTRDALADLTLIENVCQGLPSATLIKFDGADHSFKIKKNEITDELATQSAQWARGVLLQQ
jgi:uncharacterized protein